jgi:uncharacterized membrane protein YeiH
MFEVAEYIGTIAFAMSGFFVAVRSRLDFLGTLIAVFLTAFGGGIVRDVIVDKTPFAFTNDMPMIIVSIIMLVMIVFRLHKRADVENKAFFIVSDSIGLVSFSITGAMIALESELNFTGVLALSFLTAVGGGITRDIIINEVPFVFKTGFYGTVALLVGALMYVIDMLDMQGFYATLLVFLVGVTLRVLAYYKKWSVPLI